MSCKRPTALKLEVLEDRSLLSVVPFAELTEGNAAAWSTFASDGAAASLSNDTTKVAAGSQSLRFETQSGFDTGIVLNTGADSWDITSFKQLAFWTYSINNTPLGFQGNQPVVVLSSATGSYRYTPTNQDMLNQGWQKHHIPLAGDAFWQRQTIGTPDLANITSLEIHQDTWDYAFTVFYDGMQFSTRDVTDLPVAGPNAPAGVTAGAVTPRILLYAFNPIMENFGGQRLNTVYGWQDPVTLTQQSIADLTSSSHGMYRPQIVQTIIADQQPYFTDGFQHTDASFVQAWANRDFHAGFMFDYTRFIQENDLANRVDRGEIDEVWIYAPPINGMWESAMAGKDAFWVNGPTQTGGNRAFPIMGLNYERGVGEAIHSFGHRAEGTMDHAYATIQNDPNNTWHRFTQIEKNAPGQGGVGNVHFPVNGTGDYDYDNSRSVTSNASDWYNYPTFTGATQLINARAWSPTHQDPQREYLNWWYDHMPHVAGRTADFRLNNWWRYIGDLDAFKNTSKSLYGTDGTGRAWLTGVSEGTTVSGMLNLGGDTLIDGIVGRMDLYVDGVYQSSDDIGPFTFKFDAGTLSAGAHTIQVRAFEVQNNTETDSSVITVQTGGAPANHAPQINQSSITLASINEDVLASAGITVLQLVQSANITDADLGALQGIAITSAPTMGGMWQHSVNSGSTWSNLDGVSESNARLLAVDGSKSLIRFVPFHDFSGTVSLAFKAWDRTAGTSGTTANVTVNGGSSAFSSGLVTAQLSVVGLNDAPVLNGVSNLLTSINEDDSANTGDLISTLANANRITDVDSNALYGIAITSTSSTGGIWQYSLNDGASWMNVGLRSESSALLLAAEPGNRVRFLPGAGGSRFISNVNYYGPASFQYRAWDRTSGVNGGLANSTLNAGTTSFSPGIATANLTVIAVNDAPVLTLGKRTISIKRNSSATLTGSEAITLSDVDAGNGIVRITLTVQQGISRGQLSISGRGTLSALSGNNSGSLTLEGTITAINAALKRVTFKAKSGFVGRADLTIMADDLGKNGLGGNKTATDAIRVNIG
ncbi:MAG TPA: Ig-like domain-containing protein [Gemmatales bacterium]|nr:Ig-like domain-containing protein [Gemmatales bacterium]